MSEEEEKQKNDDERGLFQVQLQFTVFVPNFAGKSWSCNCLLLENPRPPQRRANEINRLKSIKIGPRDTRSAATVTCHRTTVILRFQRNVWNPDPEEEEGIKWEHSRSKVSFFRGPGGGYSVEL